MFVQAARRMGYKTVVYAPRLTVPSGADETILAPYEDLNALRGFAKKVRVVTSFSDNIPLPSLQAIEECVPLRPSGSLFALTSHRLQELTFLTKKGFPVAAYREVNSLEDVNAGLQSFGIPAVLKSAERNNIPERLISHPTDAPGAFAPFSTKRALLESIVDCACEVTVVVARAVNGATADWGAFETTYVNGRLDMAVAQPFSVLPRLSNEAIKIAHEIAAALDIVGILGVDFFLLKSERWLVKKLVPGPQGAAHLTLDAAVTHQFEQHLRSICGLPLGATDFFAPAAMANLNGSLWTTEAPVWERALVFPDVKLHLYGKPTPAPDTPMGHLTALARTPQDARALVNQARRALSPT
jgi:5-(carboxyamino)imidazole ribonucleotide synthase